MERQPLDPDVIARAQHGSIEAFEVIVATRLDYVWRLARAIGGDDVDTDDVVQEALLMMWRDLPALRRRTAFDSWLRAIVVNVIRHAVRARRSIREIPLDPPPDQRTVGGEVPDPRAPLDRSVAEQDALDRAFARLSIDERAVLVLRHIHGCSIEDVAAAIGRPAGTVKSRLSSARASLRAALDAEAR